ncbi:putative thioredoxin [Natronocella acetinitrilica]|uniref:Thioredoxin n=1 Tax=Natronocella acetinitrilica TaxID=414046 RepID=A0AAE3G4C5_9GAMM|nr:thioredoxin [Natronocella acetinitrilica]MCP1675570.1 putative thioredoxin [Natronocella acetinitrilica]
MSEQVPYIKHVTAGSFAAEVMEVSRQTPVLVDFWADWCEPCKQLMPVIERLAHEYDGRFVLAKVDCDQEQMLATQVGIRSLPTVILVKDGQIVGQFQGLQPEGEIRKLLDAHVPAAEESPAAKAAVLIGEGDFAGALPLLEEAYAASPDDTDIRIDLARARLHEGDAAGAEALLSNLPADAANDDRVKGMRAQRAFAERVAGLPDLASLQAALAEGDQPEPRHQLALQLIARGEYAAAMEELLVLIRRHADWNEGQARQTLLEVFDLLGLEHPEARRYRQKLFQMMY